MRVPFFAVEHIKPKNIMWRLLLALVAAGTSSLGDEELDMCAEMGVGNEAGSLHRILSSALLHWGRAAAIGSQEGQTWLHIAKLLRACRTGDMLGVIASPSTKTRAFSSDIEGALRAAVDYLEGDTLNAAHGWEAAADKAARSSRVPLMRYLQARAEFDAGHWEASAAAFTNASLTRENLVAAAQRDAAASWRAWLGFGQSSANEKMRAGPELPRVHKWRADAYARMGDAEQYMFALHRHVVASGECAHWPEFCLTLPPSAREGGTVLASLPPVPREVCADGHEPPLELLDEEARELHVTARLAARAAADTPPPDGAEAASVLARSRRDLVAASRQLECSLAFIRERLLDNVVVASSETPSASIHSTGDGSAGASQPSAVPALVSEIQLSYGQVYYPSVRRLLERRPVAATMQRAAAADGTFIHLGSNIGTESFYVALTHGPSVRVVGYDLLCSLVKRADELRDRFGMDAARVAFHCADALTASLKDVTLAWLDNQAWDPPFMRIMYSKLVDELPSGAMLVDFAAMDAQYDYPRNWSAVGQGDTAVFFGEGDQRLDVYGCATLDASWDRGAGTHVALLKRADGVTGKREILKQYWEAASHVVDKVGAADLTLTFGGGQAAPAGGMALAWEALLAKKPLPHALTVPNARGLYLRAVLAWHMKSFDAFNVLLQSMSNAERAYVEHTLLEGGVSDDLGVHPTLGGTPRLCVTHATITTADASVAMPQSLLMGIPSSSEQVARRAISPRRLGIHSTLLALHSHKDVYGDRRTVAVDATGATRPDQMAHAAPPEPGYVPLAEDTMFADGIAISALEWTAATSGDSAHDGFQLHLSLRDCSVLSENLRGIAAMALTRMALPELAAMARSDSGTTTPAGWATQAILVLSYPDHRGDDSSDQGLLRPAAVTLRLFASTSGVATLHSRGFWVPDYAASATLAVPLHSQASSGPDWPGATVHFTVDRGGMMADKKGEGNGGGAVHPWWCVMRQDFSQLDSAGATVPLLDAYSDMGFLDHMTTTVKRENAGNSIAREGDQSWRIAFTWP